MGRKGSRRATMERSLDKPIKTEAMDNGKDAFTMPKFLEKQASTDSITSASSDQSSTTGRGLDDSVVSKSGLTDIPEEDGEHKTDKHTQGGTRHGSPNGRHDEGLGESFDQQSVGSDMSLRSSGNGHMNGCGIRNAAYDILPEENDGSLDESESSSQEKRDPELTLDPNRLQVPQINEDPFMPPEENSLALNDSPFAQKPASAAKKVSFLWGTEENPDNPVSDTYVYEGKGGKKFKRRPTGHPKEREKKRDKE